MTNRKETTGEGITRRSFLAKGSAFAFAAAVTGPGLTILSGCGGGGGSSSEPLRFWQFHAPGGQVQSMNDWFVQTVERWNEENETKIELEYIPTQEYIDGARLQTAFSSGEGPDLFLISPGDFLRYYNGGVLEDLSQYMDQEAIDDFYPNVMQTRSVDGTIYALPKEVDPLAMYYDIRAFENAGLSEGDIPQTWEQLLEISGQLQTDDTFGTLFQTAPGYYQNFTWYPFMWQGGADAVASGESAFDTEGAVQALEFWKESIESGVAPREALGTGANDAAANLGSGYCAIQNVGIWAISQFRDSSPDLEYGIFRLPTPPGGEYVTGLGGWSFVANSEGRNPEVAGQFCAWAIGSMEDDSIDRVTQWCTEADTAIPPRLSSMERAEEAGVYDDEDLRTFQEEIFPGGREEPRYPPEVYRAISDAIQACQLDGADPQAQAERAAETINGFLEGYSGASIV